MAGALSFANLLLLRHLAPRACSLASLVVTLTCITLIPLPPTTPKLPKTCSLTAAPSQPLLVLYVPCTVYRVPCTVCCALCTVYRVTHTHTHTLTHTHTRVQASPATPMRTEKDLGLRRPNAHTRPRTATPMTSRVRKVKVVNSTTRCCTGTGYVVYTCVVWQQGVLVVCGQ